MKQLLLIFVIALVSVKSFALGEDYYIVEVGTSTNLLKEGNAEDGYTNLELKQYSGNLYYAVKEVTVTGSTLIEYQVFEDHTTNSLDKYYNYGSNQGSNNSNGHAWIYLDSEGTYTLIFTFYLDNKENSLDVVQLAKVSGPERFFGVNWGDDMSQNLMDYDAGDNCFHLYKDFEITAADVASGTFNLEYQIVTRHRGAIEDGQNNNRRILWYGESGESSGNALVPFTEAGSYSVDFSFNPFTKTVSAQVERFIEVTIGSTGFATFSCPFTTNVPGSVIAYYVTGYSGTEVTTQKTTQVPATTTTPKVGTGVIVEGDPGTHRFYETGDVVTLNDNKLAGTGSSSYEVSSGSTYVFAEKNGVVGFYLGVGSTTAELTYAAYKAYLPLSGSSAREFWGLDFLNNPSGITAVKDLKEEGRYYNLQGQPVAHPTKGLYILNGNKVVIK